MIFINLLQGSLAEGAVNEMKYRKKPVVVEAVRWTGDNIDEIIDFCTVAYLDADNPRNEVELHIRTLEGGMVANDGDYIIKGVQGEFYPCKPDIFEKTYEPVEGGE